MVKLVLLNVKKKDDTSSPPSYLVPHPAAQPTIRRGSFTSFGGLPIPLALPIKRGSISSPTAAPPITGLQASPGEREKKLHQILQQRKNSFSRATPNPGAPLLPIAPTITPISANTPTPTPTSTRKQPSDSSENPTTPSKKERRGSRDEV